MSNYAKALRKREYVLEKMQRKVRMVLTEEMLSRFAEEPQVNILAHTNFERDALVLEVVQHMLGNDVESICVRYPDGWIEAFKERYFRGWLLKKFPIKYVKETMTKTVVYPDIPIIPNKNFIVYVEHK